MADEYDGNRLYFTKPKADWNFIKRLRIKQVKKLIKFFRNV